METQTKQSRKIKMSWLHCSCMFYLRSWKLENRWRGVDSCDLCSIKQRHKMSAFKCRHGKNQNYLLMVFYAIPLKETLKIRNAASLNPSNSRVFDFHKTLYRLCFDESEKQLNWTSVTSAMFQHWKTLHRFPQTFLIQFPTYKYFNQLVLWCWCYRKGTNSWDSP